MLDELQGYTVGQRKLLPAQSIHLPELTCPPDDSRLVDLGTRPQKRSATPVDDGSDNTFKSHSTRQTNSRLTQH